MQVLMDYFGVETARDAIWLVIGMGAQLMFSARFIIQWIASERAGQSQRHFPPHHTIARCGR